MLIQTTQAKQQLEILAGWDGDSRVFLFNTPGRCVVGLTALLANSNKRKVYEGCWMIHNNAVITRFEDGSMRVFSPKEFEEITVEKL